MRDRDAIEGLVGRVLAGTYRLDRELGAGGMGAVFEATHLRTGRRYALKVMLPELAVRRESIARFRREAEAVGALGHAHVVAIHDFLESDGLVFIVMDRLEGEDLAARIERVAPMSVDAALPILRGMASGLGAAHAAGLLHRDLKPANVFLARQPGADERAVLLDFGLVKSFADEVDERLTASGVVLGTPLYMSPEQACGRALDARADLYALATVFYEMLTGRPPFAAPSLPALLARLVADPPPSLARDRPDLPAALCEVMDAGLAKDPEARFPSAAAFVQAVEDALGRRASPLADPPAVTGADPHAATVATPSPLLATPRTRAAPARLSTMRPASRARALGLVGAGALLIGALTAALFVTRDDPEPAVSEATPVLPMASEPVLVEPDEAAPTRAVPADEAAPELARPAPVTPDEAARSAPAGEAATESARREPAQAPIAERMAGPAPSSAAPPAQGPPPGDPVARATERSARGDYAGCVRILRAAPRSARVLGARMTCAMSANDGADLARTCAELHTHYPQHQYTRTCDTLLRVAGM